MKARQLRQIIDDKYADYVMQVVAQIKALGPESRTAPPDLGLADVWEEYKDQVQGQESILFEFYVETIESFCSDVLKILPEHELRLLWLETDGYLEYAADDNHSLFLHRDNLLDDVAAKLYSRVWSLAADEEMAFPKTPTTTHSSMIQTRRQSRPGGQTVAH